MKKRIKYVVSYDVLENSNENRLNILSSANKIEYIIEVLNEIGYGVDIISTSQTLNKKCYKGKKIQIDSNNTIKLFPTTWRGGFIFKIINLLIMRISILFYLTLNTKKGDKIIIYHSLGNLWLLKYLKKIKKLKVISEVEEIYSIINGNNRLAKKEIKCLKLADRYICPTKLIYEKLNEPKKKNIVVHGSYKINKIEEFEETVTFSSDKIHIGYTGLIDEKKGCFDLVKASEFLSKKYHIHILGFGPSSEINKLNKLIDRLNLKNQCTISYDGIRKGTSYQNYLSKLDIGICSLDSAEEYSNVQFPSKIISYLTANLQVICSSNRSVLTSDVADAISFYEGNSPEKIAEAIKKIKSDKNIANKIINNCHKKFKKNIKELIEEN